MSYFNNSMGNGSNGFYQASQQYAFPQGSMSFESGAGQGMMHGGKEDGTRGDFNNEQLPTGLLNALSTRGYSFEPSLLEELGINFKHILAKTKFVLTPMSNPELSREASVDSDLAGPLLFCLVFGVLLLSAGKVHFGYIYGVALFGSLSLHMLLNFMSDGSFKASPTIPGAPMAQTGLGFSYLKSASILGYAFLPLCFLAALGVFFNLDNIFGYWIGLLTVLWSTWSSSGLVTASLDLHNVRILIAYPLLIFYSVFALMAIFV